MEESVLKLYVQKCVGIERTVWGKHVLGTVSERTLGLNVRQGPKLEQWCGIKRGLGLAGSSVEALMTAGMRRGRRQR